MISNNLISQSENIFRSASNIFYNALWECLSKQEILPKKYFIHVHVLKQNQTITYCESNGKPKRLMHLSWNKDFVFANLLKSWVQMLMLKLLTLKSDYFTMM